MDTKLAHLTLALYRLTLTLGFVMFSIVSLHPEDGDIVDHRNVGIVPHRYTASQTRRPGLDSR
jgi:hypothetical protein